MEVRIYDENAKGKSISLNDFLKEMEIEDSKKNFRNWFNKIFPKNGTSYNSYYVLQHPWELLFEYGRQIKYAYQRVFNGYDETVTWDISSYLAEMLPKWMKTLKENKHGTPNSAFEGLPFENEDEGSYSDESWEIAKKRWESVLDEIIVGFETYRDDQWLSEEGSRGKFDKAMKLFVENFESFWD